MSLSHGSPSVYSHGTITSAAEPLQQVKLLSALRSGDPALIHPFLTEISKERRGSLDGDLNTGAAALHLAIRCASVETVQLLLSHKAISPNGIHPPGSGTTALHLAASLGRVDILTLLLDQQDIDDTLRDSHGRTCRDVAKGREAIKVLEDSRSFLNASYRSLLHSYVLSDMDAQPSPALVSLLESPRARAVNLSYLDDESGRSLLHEAARRKDLRLIELVVRAGADVFVRDRRGKMAYDGLGKDDRVRVFLRQFTNHDLSLIDAPMSEPPILRGYLHKYTNVARGYNNRWFVLKDGVLSYYQHQEDENIASRGAISLKNAVLKAGSGGDKTRFEVHSTASRGHTSGVQKWYMRASHPVEAARWTQAINKSMEWYKRLEVEQLSLPRKSGESNRSALRPGKVSFQSGFSTTSRRNVVIGTHSIRGSQGSFVDVGEDGRVSALGEISRNGITDKYDFEKEGVQNDCSSSSHSTYHSSLRRPPHESTFDLQGNSISAQLELTAQLFSSLPFPSDAPPRSKELRTVLKDSFSAVQTMMNEYVQMSKEREEWWKSQLQRERERQSVWEESLQTVVREGEALERELRVRSRKRGSRFFDIKTPEMRGTSTSLSKSPPGQPPLIHEDDVPRCPSAPLPDDAVANTVVRAPRPPLLVPQPAVLVTMTPQGTPRFKPPTSDEDEDAMDTDEEDEFFDAIESNNLPNLVISQLLTSPTHAEFALPSVVNLEPFIGYKVLRTRLPISSDNRPSTSLWSVLKHSIGKDLTRISFPVFFNEPTSMLQRMAEDMEFSECLDVAAQEEDPSRRIAFVAAFAMSNYSSTIGRIAKPFNPMLGETFEYVRLDKEYRYVSEQVSHHPPISACWAESPYWRYFGEVDAQNKFMGKSFEIRPTGVAHAELLLPEEWAPHYPKAKCLPSQGKVVEHYSWKKVTTSVSGFILGSPTIDHYGDMVITNHRTGDTCILTFKPRGWRGKDAFEISGSVRNADGEVTHEIAGRWNSQLICRAIGTGSGFLHPDATVSGPASPNYMAEYVLLWRNSEKMPAPFNLTPFAITLNDCPEDTLKPYLCPTDCRLRPDQRAFEAGKYERASELKVKQEEKQRTTRRAREEGRLRPHQPRWFTSQTDVDTGERVWMPSFVGDTLEYWVEREKVWKAGGNQPWKNVEHIFIDDTP